MVAFLGGTGLALCVILRNVGTCHGRPSFFLFFLLFFICSGRYICDKGSLALCVILEDFGICHGCSICSKEEQKERGGEMVVKRLNCCNN